MTLRCVLRWKEISYRYLWFQNLFLFIKFRYNTLLWNFLSCFFRFRNNMPAWSMLWSLTYILLSNNSSLFSSNYFDLKFVIVGALRSRFRVDHCSNLLRRHTKSNNCYSWSLDSLQQLIIYFALSSRSVWNTNDWNLSDWLNDLKYIFSSIVWKYFQKHSLFLPTNIFFVYPWSHCRCWNILKSNVSPGICLYKCITTVSIALKFQVLNKPPVKRGWKLMAVWLSFDRGIQIQILTRKFSYELSLLNARWLSFLFDRGLKPWSN